MENLKLTIQEIADLKEGRKTLNQIFGKSYWGKPHLEGLPYDLRTNDPKELKQRLKENNRLLREAKREYKDAVEMDEMMENNIKEIEENEKIFKEEIKKREEENAQIDRTIGKVYDHFEKVTMMSEDDGWEIKKQFDKLQQSTDTDFSDINDNMKEFIDDVTLLGYIPETYPKDDSIRPQYYIETKLNPMIDRIKQIDSPEAQKLAKQMEDYRDKYDMTKDTPLTREFEKIQKDGNLSDLWDRQQANNIKEIQKITETIDKENERKEGIRQNQKENKREMGKIATRVNDHEAHELKILEKLERLGEL